MAATQGDLLLSIRSRDTASTPWNQLLGSGDWSGLLDPLDADLRSLLLLCGDICQVTYDSFNSDPESPYCGSCRYSRSNVLQRVAFPAAGDLTVAAYLYATSKVSMPVGYMFFSQSREAWSKESNWIGYVAVSSDAAAAASGERVIFVAWRGTIRNLEWADVLEPAQVGIDDILPSDAGGAAVMEGWHVIYTSSDTRSEFTLLSAREQLLTAVRELAARYAGEKLSVVCTGHSLGAALATLCALDIVENALPESGEVPVAALVFGSPQVGNPAFKERVEKKANLKVLRVKNKPDLIPLYPSGLLGYTHVGVELLVDSRKSPFVKTTTTNPGDPHNLQGMLHTVAGWTTESAEFALQVKRSVALVNKSSAFLRDEHLVPESWWIERNKGMVLGDDGQWQLSAPDPADLPRAHFINGKLDFQMDRESGGGNEITAAAGSSGAAAARQVGTNRPPWWESLLQLPQVAFGAFAAITALFAVKRSRRSR